MKRRRNWRRGTLSALFLLGLLAAAGLWATSAPRSRIYSTPTALDGETAWFTDDSALWLDVDLSEQRVTVKRGDQEVRVMVTSSGAPGYETPQGIFEIQNRGEWFFNPRHGHGAKWWVSFSTSGLYLFHSVAMDHNRQIIGEEAEKLGTPASRGCLRMSVEDAKWIYENVPQGAKVVIHP